MKHWRDSIHPIPRRYGTILKARYLRKMHPRHSVCPKKHIKYIRGTDLDENGDAASWTFVVEHGDQFSMVTYNRQGMTISNSPGSIQRAEIFTDQIHVAP